jgi:hypothetical protein
MANNRSGKGQGSGRVKSSREMPSEPDQFSVALNLLREILQNETIHNRKYCVYCSVAMAVPLELHRKECVWRRAWKLVNEKKA